MRWGLSSLTHVLEVPHESARDLTAARSPPHWHSQSPTVPSSDLFCTPPSCPEYAQGACQGGSSYLSDLRALHLNAHDSASRGDVEFARLFGEFGACAVLVDGRGERQVEERLLAHVDLHVLGGDCELELLH